MSCRKHTVGGPSGMMRPCASPTSPSSATSPGGSSRSSTCCVPRTSRPIPWTSCWRSPMTSPVPCGTASRWAIQNRPAIRCCGARSRRRTPASGPTTSWSSPARRRGSSVSSMCFLDLAITPSSHGPATRACTRSPERPVRMSRSTSCAKTPTGGSTWTSFVGRSRHRRSSSWSMPRTTRPGCSRIARRSMAWWRSPRRPAPTC